jgi:hypothetical protein
MTDKLVLEGKPTISTQDGGMALLAELDGPGTTFVRLQSYDETKAHDALRAFIGEAYGLAMRRGGPAPGEKKLRITIEVI